MSDGREILVSVSRDTNVPLARQLEDALRDAVLTGRLQPGARLPATRTLAVDLGVSRGVVVEAYERLVTQGCLTGRAGGGTIVRDDVHVNGRTEPKDAALLSDEERRQDSGSAAHGGLLDVRPGAPDLASFPRSQWRAALTQALRGATNGELGYVAPWGVPRLRSELAHYLGRVRGAVATSDTLVITSGATQALTILARTLVRCGHRLLAVEDPSNAVQRGVLESHGVQIVNVSVDDQGIDVEALGRTNARAVLVTPAHQFPTGVLMSSRRRVQLLDWAQAVDGLIIEDDYDSEFRYDGRSTRCIQGDEPARVALVGSVSKTLAPALRLGWVVAPKTLVSAVAETKRDDDFGSDVITQLAFSEFLRSGRYDKHLRATRRLYRRRREGLFRDLSRQLPDWKIKGLSAGQHLTLELPEIFDETTVTEQAREGGVLLLPMGCMRREPGPPGITISYARLNGSQLRRVVEVLRAIAVTDVPRRAIPVPYVEEVRHTLGLAHTTNAVDYFPTAAGATSLRDRDHGEECGPEARVVRDGRSFISTDSVRVAGPPPACCSSRHI